MSLRGYFLDTNVLVVAFLLSGSDARRLLGLAREGKCRLVTSEYVLRELRHVLVKKMRMPRDSVESFILDDLAPNVLVIKKPSRQEVRAFAGKVRDRSDIPIILPCIKHKLTLVTLDSRLAKVAGQLIGARSPREAVKESAAQ